MSAKAAPQILAVLSSNGIHFVCSSGECSAELSTYCLQQDRDPPRRGVAYHPARMTDFAVTVTDNAGLQRQIPIAGNVMFVADRGFVSVRAVILGDVMSREKIASAKIAIAKDASLVPNADARDARPLTEGEIDTATGTLRHIGRKMIDRSPTASAVRLLNQASSQFAPIESYRSDQLPGLWHTVTNAAKADTADKDGLRVARHGYERCISAVSKQSPYQNTLSVGRVLSNVAFASSMRRCLQRAHDTLLRDANTRYWNSLAGS
ncbi:MAG: hypothetical protein GKS00_16485 [Alphaproteobacteria bacterium]|nr:hypothetical protein [Alphaproteobacteria bacterium]